ncbi:cytochrome-c peroxidase [Pseudorhodoplanes sp.]|uniref:cytochrome-c peroxidase n=1 Tax=Pseudorhodoplanes sp. TaxID=1934341 RepID=UPI002C577198|nr:cytochrome c peroxidase [Pseudorhodoplanes sp.]HWV54201.1 cytochrome c peroxidase [Pseudorhodoplanes sp.]
MSRVLSATTARQAILGLALGVAASLYNANAGDLNAPAYRPYSRAAPIYERSPDRELYDRAVPPVDRQAEPRPDLIENNAPILSGRLVLLGQKLFYDGRLSRTGLTACATCHDPRYAFAQPTRVSQSDTGQLGPRNAPSLINAGALPVLMWDGRFRTLEQQATSPFLRGEMGIDIREAERRLNLDAEYLHLFQAALNSRPSASGMARALAAYQRTLISETSRFDRFISNNKAATLTALELDGLLLFERKAGCSVCHQFQSSAHYQTPGLRLFTDLGFHNLGIGYAAGRFADTGRYRVSGDESDLGAFRTPSLRNVAVTAPYMHDGSLATLEEVIDFYDAGGRPNPNLSPFIKPLFLNAYEKAALVAFLRTLTDQQYDPIRTPPRETPAVSYRPSVSRGHLSDFVR